MYRLSIHTNRLNETEVVCTCAQRLKEISMWLISQEVLTLLLICPIALFESHSKLI